MPFLSKLILPLVAGVFTIYATAYFVPQTRLLFPSLFNMRHVMAGVYVDEAMPLKQKWKFFRTVRRAKLNVAEFFGGLKSRNIFVACQTQKCFNSFSSNKTDVADSHFTKRHKLKTRFVVLQPEDIESPYSLMYILAKQELDVRVGHKKSPRSLPIWFEEGLASYVSRDPRLGVLAWRDLVEKQPLQTDVTQILTRRQWEKTARRDDNLHILARQVFSRWYVQVGPNGFNSLLMQVQDGKPFSRAYKVSSIY